jgi:hypothetical protein
VDAAEHRRFLNAFVHAAQTGHLSTLEQLLTGDLAASLPVPIAA